MKTPLCLSLMTSLCSLGAAQSMGRLGLPPWDEVRDRAFHVDMESVLSTPLTVVLSYDPACHPESRIVLRVSSRNHIDVELIRGSVSLRAALDRLEDPPPAEKEAVLSLMAVKRTRGPVDPNVAMGWIKHIRSAMLHDLVQLEAGRVPRMAQFDGTVYHVYYRGEQKFTAEVPGCEVPCNGRGDSPLVQWMNVIWKQVNSMPLTPEPSPATKGAMPAAPADRDKAIPHSE